ncbi:hypothetical protein [Streptomyces thinghirensis]|uniref:hypothetical protein n=1 Tax=Streptomyces thinghirensis TaxID=551547 RepID=UPI0031E58923
MFLQKQPGGGDRGGHGNRAVTELELQVWSTGRLVGTPAGGPGKVDEVVGVGQELVHRDASVLVYVLRGTRRQQVEPAAEVFMRKEAGLGEQLVGVADAAVEDDEGVPGVGGPDEDVGGVQK